jgi:xanthine dehydrogenase accessory factor
MTQGHATDFPVLLECMRRTEPFRYLGVIGSKSKRKTLVTDLVAVGIAEDKAELFFCPIGLELGRSTPEEIAISIAAQLLQVRDAGQ